MTKFYLIRHGEPNWALNEEYKLKGHGRDLPSLTEKGVQQAKDVSKDKRLCGAELIITSPYTRAMQTAAIISKELRIDLQVEFDLREWQPDMTFNLDNMEELKELVDDYEACKGIHPDGETKRWEQREELKNRIDSVLERYLNYSRVIVVAHEQIFKTQMNMSEIANCSIIEIEK